MGGGNSYKIEFFNNILYITIWLQPFFSAILYKMITIIKKTSFFFFHLQLMINQTTCKLLVNYSLSGEQTWSKQKSCRDLIWNLFSYGLRITIIHVPCLFTIQNFPQVTCFALYIHIQIRSDWLRGSHITQYRCGYCKSEYLRVLWAYSAATGCTVAPVTVASEYPHSTFKGTLTCSSHNGTA